jgi:hypothetical protein
MQEEPRGFPPVRPFRDLSHEPDPQQPEQEDEHSPGGAPPPIECRLTPLRAE